MSYKPDHIHIAEDANQLYRDCAENIVEYAVECVKAGGKFSMALAGGSTPQQLYLQLSSSPLAEQMPWQSCQFYFGDERMVPHDHTDSNYAMAKQALFDRVPIPAENIHPIPTDCDEAAYCADQYEKQLTSTPTLDLVLLGMGLDGHTASLFPDTDILNEKQKDVAAVYVEKLAAWRISLTYPCINRSACVIILVKGKDKTDIVHQVLHGDNSHMYPVSNVRPTGQLIWYLDRDAIPDNNT